MVNRESTDAINKGRKELQEEGLVMQMEQRIKNRILCNAFLSLLIYALPVLVLLLSLSMTGRRLATMNGSEPATVMHTFLTAQTACQSPMQMESAKLAVLRYIRGHYLIFFVIVLGIVEFSLGFYDNRWTGNERTLDIACFFYQS